MLDQLALWLLTYLLHSTLLLLSAWVLARAFPAAGERLWRLALFGGVVTATLHAGGWLPRASRLEVPGLRAAQVGTVVAPRPIDQRRPDALVTAQSEDRAAARGRRATSAAPIRQHHDATSASSIDVAAASASVRGAAAADSRRGAAGPRDPVSWWTLAALAWLSATALSIATLACRTARFRWRFMSRRETARGEGQRLLRELARRASFDRPLRLTTAAAARVPMARGWLHPEICLPPGVEEQLEPEELEAALAHELAHLERHDPLWRAVTRGVASALPFQPLNRIACRALEDEAELRCDDRAAALTGRPAALARCLTRVASWTAGEDWRAALPALAGKKSTLHRRVLRLLEQRPRRSSPWWGHLLAVLPPVAVLALAPGLGAAPPSDPAANPASLATTASAPLAERSEQSRGDQSETGSRGAAAPVVHRLALPTFEALQPVPPLPPQPPVRASAALPSEFAVALLGPGPSPATAPPADDEESENESDEDYDENENEDEDEDEDEEEYDETEEQAEHMGAIADEVGELLEGLGAEIEMAMETLEQALEEQLEAVSDEIDGQVDSFDQEIEQSLEPLEDVLDQLESELDEANEAGDQPRAERVQRRIGEVAGAMGDLGGRIGALVAESALAGVDQHLQTLVEVHSKTVQDFARAQAEVGRQLAQEILERQRTGQSLHDAEIEELERRLQEITEQAEPHYEQLERQVEELGRQLEPERERMRGLSVEIRREVDAWRLRHAELLRELEREGIATPEGEDDREDEAEPDADSEPRPDAKRDGRSAPRPAPDRELDAKTVESFA